MSRIRWTLSSKSEEMQLGYPRNLLCIIFDMEYYEILSYEMPDDILDRMTIILSVLSERERKIVNYKYVECMSEDRVAFILALSKSRLNHLEVGIVKKLRDQFCINVLKNGISWYENEMKYAGSLSNDEKRNLKLKYISPYYFMNLLDSNGERIRVSKRSISSLIDINIRTSCRMETIGDLVDCLKSGNLKNSKNVGNKTIDEITDVLLRLGFSHQDLFGSDVHE